MAKRISHRRKFVKPEDFEAKANEYFEICEANEKPITMSGLRLHLGLYSKRTFFDYEHREGFEEVVARAKARVEQAYEERLFGNNATGPIFALKNMGWSDKLTQELTGKDGGAIQTEDVSDLEFARRLAFMLDRGARE